MITRLLEGWGVSRRGAGEGRERGARGAACAMGAARPRLANGALAHPRQLALELVVALFFALLGCLLLLLKSGVVGGDQLVLVRALVVMVAQYGLKQM